jgi:hypothetical protein
MPGQPSWWQTLKNKLNQLGTPAGLGGGVQIPKIPISTQPPKTQTASGSWWQQMQNQLNQIPVGGTPSPLQSTPLPSWLQPKPPASTANAPVNFNPGPATTIGPAGGTPMTYVAGPGGIVRVNMGSGEPVPITPTAPITPTTPDYGGYGGGGYGGYKKRRGGGGYRYQPRTYQPTQYDNSQPEWAKSAGLANWSIG